LKGKQIDGPHSNHFQPGTIGLTQAEAEAKFGNDQIKIYQSKFTALYHSMTDRKQMTNMKLVCAGPEEKVVGLHMIGRACDEMLQVSLTLNLEFA
jgi:NADPH-glutathione reductase (EC 1.8.1.7)